MFFKKVNHKEKDEKIVKIVYEQLIDFQKGWENLVASIDRNTKAITLNATNLLTIDSNVRNTENEIQKMAEKHHTLEQSSKDYFEKVEKWTQKAHESIAQLRLNNEEVS